jgi:hypothetical protein
MPILNGLLTIVCYLYILVVRVLIGYGLYGVLCWTGVTGFGVFVEKGVRVREVLCGRVCVS